MCCFKIKVCGAVGVKRIGWLVMAFNFENGLLLCMWGVVEVMHILLRSGASCVGLYRVVGWGSL